MRTVQLLVVRCANRIALSQTGHDFMSSERELASNKVVSWKELKEVVPFSRTTCWRMWNEGLFPRPVHIGRTACWLERDILDWIDAQFGAEKNEPSE